MPARPCQSDDPSARRSTDTSVKRRGGVGQLIWKRFYRWFGRTNLLEGHGRNDHGFTPLTSGASLEPDVVFFSADVAEPAGDVLCDSAAGPAAVVVSAGQALPPSVAAPVLPSAGEAAMFPRISGKPSFALPMITTFEFVDCES